MLMIDLKLEIKISFFNIKLDILIDSNKIHIKIRT